MTSYRLRVIGVLLAGFAIYLAISLFSFDSSDPSFNSVGGDAVNNIGGLAGAYISDIMLQTLGLASIFPVVVLGYWAISMIRAIPVTSVAARTILLLITLPAVAVVFSFFAAPHSWPLTSGVGGYMGFFLQHALKPFIGSVALIFFATILGGLGVLSAANISLEQAAEFWWRLREWAQTITPLLMSPVRLVANMFHWNADKYEYEDESPPVRRRSAKQREEETEDEEDEDEEPVIITAEREETPKKAKTSKKAAQEKLALRVTKSDGFALPDMDLLSNPPKSKKETVNQSALTQNARILENVLQDFGVQGKIINVKPGPVVTLYEMEPAPGLKSSRVIGLAEDIARNMSAVSARIAVIPGVNAIGIELPNTSRETVFLRGLLESPEYQDSNSQLPMVLGKDIGGSPIVVDLAKMPHLLVAGTTGSGKSVGINTMILSLVYRLTPAQCRFIMIDPKMLELSIYDGIPHLLSPVVTEPGKAVVALKWAVKEMENRYRLMSNLGVRNISGYNQRIKEAAKSGEALTRRVQTGFDPNTGTPIIEEIPLDMNPLPFIVVIVDEMADLMLVAGKDIEASIQRLAQMARAAGIHIIMATQRPSVDVITGVIKANFPTRISFMVTSRIDSRTILGEQGAEQLLGQGDMLYMSGGSRITRVHGAFVKDEEVQHVVNHLKSQGQPEYITEVTEHEEADDFSGEGEDDDGESDLYRQAVEIVKRDKKVSTSYIQRRLRIGYNKAASLIERMEEEGVISAPGHSGKREILGVG